MSATIRSIFRPLIPPAALSASKRASGPFVASKYFDEPSPERSVMNPILIVVGVIPGALAVLPLLEECPVGVVVLLAPLFFDELPQAAKAVINPTAAAAVRTWRFFKLPLFLTRRSPLELCH